VPSRGATKGRPIAFVASLVDHELPPLRAPLKERASSEPAAALCYLPRLKCNKEPLLLRSALSLRRKKRTCLRRAIPVTSRNVVFPS
jgi:hypothetical protein